ncbi:3-phosphoshikimate 1-carboxyvinyltransferase 1 [Tersicoccus solisilvae]|uniref:3-phosphoshikimate 1-carboxyvinyltransferase n=1 Tax=Tersicoccus solisilvae TaxID=1882339 RepID=A0ABQ1NXX2_9MICC|nr:3-phosphoshikimate 1-carboxyvinyltransferase [Tersicoccus solisilvae]GGC87016.1 3-phosphoshikimate 1-carboxyvinyltransferase 1 [Tersicoccus solisilvae]
MTGTDDAAQRSLPWWEAPLAPQPVDAVLSVPGSKSLTNRYLVLGALAGDGSRLRSPLHSRDTHLMLAAVRALGARVEDVPGDGDFGPDWRFTAPIPTGVPAPEVSDAAGASGPAPERSVDCGLAGTVMRFVPPLAALTDGPVRFDGDEGARRRPMAAVLHGLRALGVTVDDDGRGTLPFTVHGTGAVTGDHVVIDASASSQFVSALLLAAPRFARGLRLEHAGAPIPSLPHVEMTVQVLREAGVAVDDGTPDVWTVRPGPVRHFDVAVEPDLSNAGPFLAAALVTGGRVTVTGWPEHTTQGGDHWRQILPAFGATVTRGPDLLTVTGPTRLRPVDLDLSAAGELAPTVAALAAVAPGRSRLRGIAHLRGHETDRLAALRAELTRAGATTSETDDGLVIDGGALHAADLRSYADHRMATFGAVLGLVTPGVRVQDIATTAKTMPEFADLWARMLAGTA